MIHPTLLALVLVACDRPEPAEPPPAEVPEPQRPDVVLITLDTTRADRIGAYGYEQALTPAIDALAAAGLRYDRAYSPLPLTIPAHASILTGRYPPTLGIRDNGGATLSPSETTMAEVLGSHGYQSGASVAAFVTTRTWGFDQGFDAYFDDVEGIDKNFWHAERPGAEVVDDALAWLADRSPDAPVFLWVHLYDPHFPYVPPSPWRESQAGRPYDGELAYTDAQVKRVVDAFAGREALFVVVGDHGEGLGEHGELTHGLYVYDATQRVPMVITGPGVEPGVVDQPVSLVDVLPTVLDLVDLPAPEGIEGRVVPAETVRPVYMESHQLRSRFGIAPHLAVVDGPHKLIQLPRPELYDLVSDPGETEDLAAGRAEEVARLQGILDAFGFPAPEQEGVQLDPLVALQLEALGYVEGGFAGDLSGPLPDPKDHVRLVGLSQRAERRMLQRKPEEAIEVLATLVGEYPDVTEFRNRLSSAYLRIGKVDEALATVEAALERDPESLQLQYTRATLLARKGRYREAADLFRSLADAMSYAPRVRTMAVASLLATEGGLDEGMALGAQYLRDHPDDDALAGLMGVQLARMGDPGRAVPLLEQGLRADRPERDVAFTLGAMKKSVGELEEARQLMEREVENYPRNQPALVGLVALYGQQEDWQATVELLEEVGGQFPDSAVLQHAHAQSLFNLQRFDEARVVLDRALEASPGSSMLLLLDANLLKKEGRDQEALARFEEAKAALAREEADREEPAPAAP